MDLPSDLKHAAIFLDIYSSHHCFSPVCLVHLGATQNSTCLFDQRAIQALCHAILYRITRHRQLFLDLLVPAKSFYLFIAVFATIVTAKNLYVDAAFELNIMTVLHESLNDVALLSQWVDHRKAALHHQEYHEETLARLGCRRHWSENIRAQN